MYLTQNEAIYKSLLFNKMVQKTSWQEIYMCFCVVKTTSVFLLLIFKNVSRTSWKRTAVSLFDLVGAQL